MVSEIPRYACEKGAEKVLDALFEEGVQAETRHTFPGDTPFAIAAAYKKRFSLSALR